LIFNFGLESANFINFICFIIFICFILFIRFIVLICFIFFRGFILIIGLSVCNCWISLFLFLFLLRRVRPGLPLLLGGELILLLLFEFLLLGQREFVALLEVHEDLLFGPLVLGLHELLLLRVLGLSGVSIQEFLGLFVDFEVAHGLLLVLVLSHGGDLQFVLLLLQSGKVTVLLHALFFQDLFRLLVDQFDVRGLGRGWALDLGVDFAHDELEGVGRGMSEFVEGCESFPQQFLVLECRATLLERNFGVARIQARVLVLNEFLQFVDLVLEVHF